MFKITSSWLDSQRACLGGCRRFDQRYPEGITIDRLVRELRQHKGELTDMEKTDIWWVAGRVPRAFEVHLYQALRGRTTVTAELMQIHYPYPVEEACQPLFDGSMGITAYIDWLVSQVSTRRRLVLRFLMSWPGLLDEEVARLQAALDRPQGLQPDWSEAPSWASWWAVDADGEAFWYEKQPKAHPYNWSWWYKADVGEIQACPAILSLGSLDWRESARERPKKDLPVCPQPTPLGLTPIVGGVYEDGEGRTWRIVERLTHEWVVGLHTQTFPELQVECQLFDNLGQAYDCAYTGAYTGALLVNRVDLPDVYN